MGVCKIRRIDILTNSIKRLKDFGYRIELKILGNGRLFTKLSKLVKTLNLNEVGKLYAFWQWSDFFNSVDIFVNSAKFESFSIHTIEASIAKCLLSDKNIWFNRSVTDRENGLLVDIDENWLLMLSRF